MLAFGELTDDPRGNLEVGEALAEALRKAGFAVDWNGSMDTRIALPAFDWKRRAPAGTAPIAPLMVARWLNAE